MSNYNYDQVIVNLAYVNIFSYLMDSETTEEAEARGSKYYEDELALVTSHLANYGGDYWKQQVESCTKNVISGCKVMTFEEFRVLERNKLLDGKLTEVTKEQYWDALEQLPPLHWTTHNNVEMFCISEMWTASYTSQYAHDKSTNKYYCAMVDSLDRSTWICEFLKKTA